MKAHCWIMAASHLAGIRSSKTRPHLDERAAAYKNGPDDRDHQSNENRAEFCWSWPQELLCQRKPQYGESQLYRIE